LIELIPLSSVAAAVIVTVSVSSGFAGEWEGEPAKKEGGLSAVELKTVKDFVVEVIDAPLSSVAIA
jgi:hypothetical protein